MITPVPLFEKSLVEGVSFSRAPLGNMSLAQINYGTRMCRLMLRYLFCEVMFPCALLLQMGFDGGRSLW